MTGDFLFGVFIGVVSCVALYAMSIIYDVHWGD